MNDEQRAALMEEMARAMHGGEEVSNGYRYAAAQCLPIIDRLLADRAATVAEPDAVEAVAKVIWGWGSDSYITPTTWHKIPEEVREYYRDQAREVIAAMPSGADAEWLDEALDSVSDSTLGVYVGLNWGGREFVAEICADDATDSDPATVIANGTGTTRREAILDAVQKAKEASDG